MSDQSTPPEQTPESPTLAGPLDLPTTRRRALLWLIRIALAVFAVAFMIPALALKTLRRGRKTVEAGDELVYAQGSNKGSAVNADELAAGSALHVFPKGKTDDSDNLIELVHLSEGSPSIVAYSAICTHLGCSVLTNLTDDGDIPCPCHGSVFNPAQDAKVVAGPAPRPLPSLPIDIHDDGTITATGGFDGEVGPD